MRWTRVIALLAASLLLPAVVTAAIPVVDGHTHQGIAMEDGSIHLENLEHLGEMGFGVVTQILPLDRSDTDDLLGRLSMEIERLHSIDQGSDVFYLVEFPGEPLTPPSPQGVGVLLGTEWFGAFFEGDESRSFRLAELGIRTFGLPDNDPDGIFLKGDQSDVLSPFGQRVVDSLNRAGVMIDLTHLSHERKLTIIAAAPGPTVVTHGNVRSAADREFNLPDNVLEALAANEGHVWVSFNRNGVLVDGEEDGEAVSRLVNHVQTLSEHLGPEHIGIGTDLQADGKYVPVPLFREDTLHLIRKALAERGFTRDEVEGLMGLNVLRTLATADRNQSHVH